MDIVIKSYNRAYLLDRVLYSIYKYVTNGLGSVIVLDDGTPEIFLRKIKEKYSNVIIKKAPNQENLKGNTKVPPIQFWRQEIDKCSDYVMVLEDDIWLTQEIDLSVLEEILKDKNIDFLKLKWWGNPKMIQGDYTAVGDLPFGIVRPQLNPFSEALVKNKFYLHSIANLLKVMPKNYFLSLYTVYDVAGQIFSKDFYKYVWPEDQVGIEEMIQLGKAAEYFRQNKDRKVARMECEYTATTFYSSSVGSVEKYGFDMNLYNNIWNQKWLSGDLDTLYHFPLDFSLSYLEQFVKEEENAEKWKKWSINWRKHFQELGSELSVYNHINELN